MRLRRILGTGLEVLGTFFIGLTITLFLVFPRVVNQLASVLGNMGDTPGGPPFEWGQAALHVAIAVVIDLLLLYFFIVRPTRRLRDSLEAPGLEVRKGAGRAYIDTESVRQRVIAAIAQVADIQHTDVIVQNEAGRAVIRLNIVTDVLLNGPKKKNEINREVRKIVEDQLGVDVKGKPTIIFTLSNEADSVPLIGAGSSTAEAPAMMRNMPPAPPPEPEMAPIPQKPSGIELAKSDPMKSPDSRTPAPKPMLSEDSDLKPPEPVSVENMTPTAPAATFDDADDEENDVTSLGA